MKTKIIYISGAEVFDMADVRAAFEEVRTTLGLDKDTVMFGVPVDADDALAVSPAETHTAAPVIPNMDEEKTAPASNDASEPQPKKKPGRPAKKSSEKVINSDAPVTTQSTLSTPERIAASDTEPKATTDEPVIPILSVLAATDEAAPVPDAKDSDTPADDEVQADITAPDMSADIADDIIDNTTVPAPTDDTEPATDTSDTEQTDIEIQSVSIQDMVADDAPVAPREKTLEELLESMAPLSDDNITPVTDAPDIDVADVADSDTTPDIDSTDATLEQLATEFAAAGDKISAPTKAENRGKIGKLKNILPFKKVKREDTGLMGDLFGWAGIAANDEDFAMPGFFTTSASKK